jgi:hypothetical protein
MQLILRRANISRRSGSWSETDYDVVDGKREIGRVYRVDDKPEVWFWGVSFQLTGRKSYGHVPTLATKKWCREARFQPPTLLVSTQ